MDEVRIDKPGQDYDALMQRSPRLDVATMLEAYDREYESKPAEEAEKPSTSKRVMAIAGGGLAVVMLAGLGWWGFGPESGPLTKAAAGVSSTSQATPEITDVVTEEPIVDDGAKAAEEAEAAKAAEEAEAAEEASKADEAKAEADRKAEEDKKAEPEPAPTETEEVEEDKKQSADSVAKVIKTQNDTEIIEFKDKNLPPYEKPFCFPAVNGCVEKGISPSDSYTGNTLNDEPLAYRMDLGARKLGGLDSSFVSENMIVSAMTDTVAQLKLDIPVPSSPDYASARVYSSGYSLWPISKGYTLIYGDSRGLGIIGPDDAGKAFDSVLNSNQQAMIGQTYAGKKAVTFAPLYKTVPGSVIPDNEGEWQ